MRTLNLRLTAILLVVGVVFGGGVYFLHAYQVRRNAYVFEREADRALDLAAKAAKDKDPQAEKKAYQDAIKNLAWYVRLVPDNVDVLEKLGMLMADHIQDARAFARAFGFLERVLRQEPGRMNVRRRLVGLAIMARRYQDAKEHLQEFLLKDSPKDAELWELLGRCNVGMGEYDLAVENFKKAIEISPTQVEVYLQLAMVLRTHFSRAKEADQWMTKLVQTNPKSFRAHLLRGNYLKNINADDDALREAQKSLELAPDNRDALWLTAQCYFAKGEYEKSRDCATRGIKLYPRTIDMYTALADIELRSGNRDAAIAALQQGLKATEQSPQLLWSMANLLMDVNKLKEAEPIIEELRATEYPKQFVEYLNARREFIQGHWLAARQGFEKVRGLLTTWPGLLKQVDVWIGQCYGQVGNRDLQIESYRRALKMDPFYIPAKVGLTEALLAAGNVDDAIKEYRELGKLGRLTTAGLIPMARMFILQNLRQASSDRNWAPAEQVLEQAEKANPDAVQIPILRAEILVAQNRQADAEALLRKALEKAPKQIELWTGLVSLAARQKDWTKAEQLLEELRKAAGDVVEYRLTQAQYLVRRDGQKAADDVRKLAEDIGRFSDAQRLQLWGGLLDIAIRVNDTQLAKRLCQQIAEKEPNNPQIRYLLFEQALQARDDAGMEQALKEIEQVAGQGAYWLYGQAVRLTLQAKDQIVSLPAHLSAAFAP